MTDQFVQVAVDGTGKKIDTSELTVGSNAVQRQRVVIGHDTDPDAFAAPNQDGSLPVDIIGQLKELIYAVRQIIDQPWVDPATGRLRILLDAIAGSLTLGTVSTVTTCSTVTNMSQIGAVPANSLVQDAMDAVWYESVRRCIS